jgi:hypothetical protein
MMIFLIRREVSKLTLKNQQFKNPGSNFYLDLNIFKFDCQVDREWKSLYVVIVIIFSIIIDLNHFNGIPKTSYTLELKKG